MLVTTTHISGCAPEMPFLEVSGLAAHPKRWFRHNDSIINSQDVFRIDKRLYTSDRSMSQFSRGFCKAVSLGTRSKCSWAVLKSKSWKLPRALRKRVEKKDKLKGVTNKNHLYGCGAEWLGLLRELKPSQYISDWNIGLRDFLFCTSKQTTTYGSTLNPDKEKNSKAVIQELSWK